MLLKQQRPELEALLPDTPWRTAQRDHLESNFGLRAAEVVSQWPTADRHPLSDVIPVCRGELAHAIHAEHARSVIAVLARRSRLAMVDVKAAEELVPMVNELLEPHPESCGGQHLNLAH